MKLALRALPLVVLAAVASGCGTLHSGAVAQTGPCAEAIPIAQARAGHTSTLIHARALKRGNLSRVLDGLGLHPEVIALERERARRARRLERRRAEGRRPARRTPLPRVSCLLVYRGSFHTKGATRRYLVLVIRVRHPVVFADVPLDKLPPGVAKLT